MDGIELPLFLLATFAGAFVAGLSGLPLTWSRHRCGSMCQRRFRAPAKDRARALFVSGAALLC
jgi:hypothetical protein